MQLEQIIRPFQSPDAVSGRGIISDATRQGAQIARIVWGATGQLPVAQQQDANTGGLAFKVIDCQEHYSETSRQSDTVRVENPDDSSQFVMVKRVSTIAFDKKTNTTQGGAIGSETTAFSEDPGIGTTFDVDQSCKTNYKLKNK